MTVFMRRYCLPFLALALFLVLQAVRFTRSWIGEFPDSCSGTVAAAQQLSWRIKIFPSRIHYVVAFRSRQTASTFELHYNQSTQILELIKTRSAPFHAFRDKRITLYTSPQEIYDAALRGQAALPCP